MPPSADAAASQLPNCQLRGAKVEILVLSNDSYC